jgi:Zn-dependent protease with chaperone function
LLPPAPVEVEQEMPTKRLAVTLAMAAMAGAGLCAGQSETAPKSSVTVCMEPGQHVLMGVRPLASAMFARIGVRIDWREPDSCPAGAGVIRVRLSHNSSGVRDSGAEALAFARPYAGTVVVFLDRIQELNRDGVPSLLAHVLVHEIAHVLEGIDRHSATGIMKARWDYRDYFEMRRKPLTFAQEDVNLIYDGLKVPRVAVAAAVAGSPGAGVAGR